MDLRRHRRLTTARRDQQDRRPCGRKVASPQVTEFVGVSFGPRGGVEPGIGLYQFALSSGAPVRLHDMFLRHLLWEPGASATLTLAFEWASGWAPPELSTTPFVIMNFAGVRLLMWSEDDEPLVLGPEVTEDPSGQVNGFDWDGASLFDLQTLSCQIIFRAESVTISAATTSA